MIPRKILDRSSNPDGEILELAIEATHYVIRVAGVPLMTSETSGSEEAMAEVAAELLGHRRAPRVLVGGLGMGFSLRATLEAFDEDAEVMVAELLQEIIGYNEGVLGELAGHPLEDPRVILYEGDVREPLRQGGWDAILMDVDNGPSAFTADSNRSLYSKAGARLMAEALNPGGVLVVWSAYPDTRYEKRLNDIGLRCEMRKVWARGKVKKGGRHFLFVAQPR